jgi:hypothetical protein
VIVVEVRAFQPLAELSRGRVDSSSACVLPFVSRLETDPSNEGVCRNRFGPWGTVTVLDASAEQWEAEVGWMQG